MSKGNTFENDLVKLIFQGTAISQLGENASSSAFTNIYVALHTVDPGEAGSQNTNETTYANYARIAVARSALGWTITNNSVSPVANIDFVASTEAAGTITHFSVGTAISGAGKLMYSGTVTPNITLGVGVTPRLTTASAITEE